MEVIRLAGYTEEEKREIARRHLLPKQMEENGISAANVNISRLGTAGNDSSVTRRKPGCDNSSARSASICRKVARRVSAKDRKARLACPPKTCTSFWARQDHSR